MSLGKDRPEQSGKGQFNFLSACGLSNEIKLDLGFLKWCLLFIKILQRAAVEDINPADDPNNQGEDEFEEAGQVREENLPDENEEQKQSHQKQQNAEMEEHLVVSGCRDGEWF